tara:strand:- start:1467 stop:1691 length:225 start_codon:yes stop_codon:yes gene_type:complete
MVYSRGDFMSDNKKLLFQLENEVIAMEGKQLRFNTYGGMVLTDRSIEMAALHDRIAAIDWTQAEINNNEAQYDC